MIVIIDNYDSFTYNIYQALCRLSNEPVKVLRSKECSIADIEALNPSKLVLSPGPGRPEDAGITVAAIRHFAGKIPMLGVCLGHQAIGEAFGGRIVGAKDLMHGKTSAIYHDGKGLFSGVSSPFEATRYHSLIVERSSLPAVLLVTAETKGKEIMGLRHKDFPVYGVQFHPESILTPDGKKILKNFLDTK